VSILIRSATLALVACSACCHGAEKWAITKVEGAYRVNGLGLTGDGRLVSDGVAARMLTKDERREIGEAIDNLEANGRPRQVAEGEDRAPPSSPETPSSEKRWKAPDPNSPVPYWTSDKPVSSDDAPVWTGRTTSEVKYPSFGEAMLFLAMAGAAIAAGIGPLWLIVIVLLGKK